MPIVIVVHGGAGALPDSAVIGATNGTRAAAEAGFAVLRAGGSAVDAVEAAVRVMEDLPQFNAGTGSALNAAGDVECDALLCEGARLRAGAVTGIRSVRNPISLARAVMDKAPHVFLAGAAGDQFAAAQGLQLAAPGALVTAARRAQLADVLAARAGGCATTATTPTVDGVATRLPLHARFDGGAVPVHDEAPPCAGDHDTVGAVALDARGNMASATSTGGLTGKWPGRIGDTPIIGAGGVADNDVGAASVTGTGELIMRFGLARAILSEYQHLPQVHAPKTRNDVSATWADADATAAVTGALARMAARFPDEEAGEGGIFISSNGGVGVAHSSARMPWASIAGAARSAEGADAEGGEEEVVVKGGVTAPGGPVLTRE